MRNAVATIAACALLAFRLAFVPPFGNPRVEPGKGLDVGDSARGMAVFERRCTGCHALDASREGPPLRGVYARRAGSAAGFDYSAGLKSAGITWNDATLEMWLSDPDRMVPDNKMGIRVPKRQDRSDLIAFFKQLK